MKPADWPHRISNVSSNRENSHRTKSIVMAASKRSRDRCKSDTPNTKGRAWRVFRFLTDWPAITLITLLTILTLIGWLLTRNPAPKYVNIAAGPKSQAYERVGDSLMTVLQNNGLHKRVRSDSTFEGSPANAEALRREREKDGRDFNIGIVQGTDLGRASSSAVELRAVTPIILAQVCVAIRKETLGEELGDDLNFLLPDDAQYQAAVAKILRRELSDMAHVDFTKNGSGTQRSAEKLREHYHSATAPAPQQAEGADAEQPSMVVNVLIRQTAWLDEDTIALLRSDEFELVEIDAGALALQAEYDEVVIPAGAYGYDDNNQRIPRADIRTVASTDYIAVRGDAPDALVYAILDAAHGDPAGFAKALNLPGATSARPPIQLITQQQIVSEYLNESFHPAAQAYFHPFDPSELATWTEFLAGSKDLLVAIAAGVFLLYGLRVRLEKRAEDQKMREEKAILDEYLSRTITLEGEQWNCRDPERLEKILAEVTAIKIEALDKLSHEDLRSDRAFSIFIMQCANVINKIQMKILAYGGKEFTSAED